MAPKATCSHNELITKVAAIEAGLTALRQVLDERDERYKQRAASQDDIVSTALSASEKAVAKAEAATEKRFDNVNEFRETLADQASTLMPRAEYGVQHAALVDRIAAVEAAAYRLRTDVSAMQARGGGVKETWGYILAIAALFVAAVVGYFRH